MRKSVAFSVVAAVTIAAASCVDSPLGGTGASVPPPMPPREARAAVATEYGPDGLITLIVRLQSNDLAVSAYQGAVTFPRGLFELVSVALPDSGQAGPTLNTTGFAEGSIRFAAFAATPFAGTGIGEGAEIFRFTVFAPDSVAAPVVTAHLDVVITQNKTS